MSNQTPRITQHRWFAVLTPLFLLSCVALLVVNILEYRSLGSQAYETERMTYQAGTLQAASAMEQFIRTVEREAETLAAAIGDSSLEKEDYQKALALMLKQDPMFYGGAVAFLPYALDPERRLYAPYYGQDGNGGLEFMYIEDRYDYTAAGQEWFVAAIEDGSRWSTPYFDESVGDILMTTYSAVVYWSAENGEKRAVAVVTIDVSLEDLGSAIKSAGQIGNGYIEILTDQGLYLYSPENSRVLNQASLFGESRWARDEGFEQLQRMLVEGVLGVVQVQDSISGEFQLVSVAPIDQTGWRVLGNLAARDVSPKTAELRHRLMLVILGVVLALCAALVYRQFFLPGKAVISWPTALLVSLVLLIGIAAIWRVAMDYASEDDRVVAPLASEQAVSAQAAFYRQRARERLMEQPLVVPTGIYLESMRFLSSSDILVVGSVWQRFDVNSHRDTERGVIFPGAARLRMEEPFVLREGDTELVRWHFSAEWRFHHRYSRYPLVKDVFGIGILSRDTANNVLLLPDVSSYPYITPSSLPGLSPDVFLLGWDIENTYFELRQWRQNTTFGREARLTVDNLPELYYSAEVEKAFIHSIISNLTPLAIAITITFITLLISTRDKERLDVLRTGVGFDIGISTSIFFVVVLSHIGLRERIVSEEVFYLEYFYLLMYANLIWLCCHSILSVLDSPWLDRITMGMAAKKLFFPVNFLVIFAFTWLRFFN